MSEATRADLMRMAQKEADTNGEFNLHRVRSHFGRSTKEEQFDEMVKDLLIDGRIKRTGTNTYRLMT